LRADNRTRIPRFDSIRAGSIANILRSARVDKNLRPIIIAAMITNSCTAALSKKAPLRGLQIDARDRLSPDTDPKPRRLDGVFYCPVSGSPPGDDHDPTFRSSLHGLWLPLITPFRDGELDETSLRRLVRHYAALPSTD
jgi:hypothetical protein